MPDIGFLTLGMKYSEANMFHQGFKGEVRVCLCLFMCGSVLSFRGLKSVSMLGL